MEDMSETRRVSRVLVLRRQDRAKVFARHVPHDFALFGESTSPFRFRTGAQSSKTTPRVRASWHGRVAQSIRNRRRSMELSQPKAVSFGIAIADRAPRQTDAH
jgi:hypothetical protein